VFHGEGRELTMFHSIPKALVRAALALGILTAVAGIHTAPVHATSGCPSMTATYEGEDTPTKTYYVLAQFSSFAGVQYNSYFENTTNQTVYSGDPSSWTTNGSYSTEYYHKMLATGGVPWVSDFTDQNANGCASNAVQFTTS